MVVPAAGADTGRMRDEAKGWLIALVRGWQEDWRITRGATKVVLAVVSVTFLAFAAFAIWFWTGFRF